ncbi:hypothetical protein [Providencia heimbachae]|uniref:phage tail termination protein n=1 Tax=Providencia TaxID=586 RepID=UPI0008392DD7|nr:hypothetical protein [Providencia heimbachae]QCJ70859.1 hypothetical protein C9446_13980 [Providencia heimbachae]
MKPSDIYQAIRDWLTENNFDDGFKVQERFWRDGAQLDKFIVIQRMGGSNPEEALVRDSYRLILISADGGSQKELEDLAFSIRDALIRDHKIGCMTYVEPIGSINQSMSDRNRLILEINFNTIISR